MLCNAGRLSWKHPADVMRKDADATAVQTLVTARVADVGALLERSEKQRTLLATTDLLYLRLSVLVMTHMPALFFNRVRFRRKAYGATEISESLLLVATDWSPWRSGIRIQAQPDRRNYHTEHEDTLEQGLPERRHSGPTTLP